MREQRCDEGLRAEKAYYDEKFKVDSCVAWRQANRSRKCMTVALLFLE